MRTRHALLTTTALIVSACGLARGQEMSDAEIRRAVQTELRASDAVPDHRIAVSVTDGRVTLTGSTPHALGDVEASRVASSVRGVGAVVDRVTVATPDRADAAIATDVRDALLRDPAADAYELDVRVSDAVAYLSGDVESWHELRLAERVAAGVRGVVRVDSSGVSITTPPQRPDGEILAEVRGLLAADVRVGHGAIDVSVDDAAVTLTGAVASPIERQLAIADAWVRGVRDVRAGGLRVDPAAADAAAAPGGTTPDNIIQTTIGQALLYDPRVTRSDVRVTAADGEVTLTGTVETLRESRAAETLARSTAGVSRVFNLLAIERVKTSDADKRNTILAKLARDPYLRNEGLSVRVDDGVATLGGEVGTSFERLHARAIADTVPGVHKVRNRVDARAQWRWRPDHELARDVRDQLYWSPFVDAQGITVRVEDGVVTLSGEVGSYDELASARANALDANPRSVRLRLRVTP